MSKDSMRALYLSHTGMTEPLGQSQVLPYLRGLVQSGWKMDLVAFEPPNAREEDIRQIADGLRSDGIGYFWARRRISHSLAVKVVDAGEALGRTVLRALASRPRIVHARSYLPGAVAQLVATVVPRARFIFDCRGLLGEEYADFGHWSRTSFRYRLLKRFEQVLFGRATAVVTLTERLRQWLRDQRMTPPETIVEVIPCCADLDRFRPDEDRRAAARARLGAGDRFVLAYAGTLGSYYCDDELAVLFAAIRRRRPAQLALFTRAPTDRLRAALAREGVNEEDVWVGAVPPAEMPMLLAGADAAASLIRPWFSKIASSPVKFAEYLGVGLPVAANRGVGDIDRFLSSSSALVDAGGLSRDELGIAADALLARAGDPAVRVEARRLAVAEFDLNTVGVARYRQLYERVSQ